MPVRIVDIDRLADQAISRFGSHDFRVGRLGVLDTTHLMAATVAPGGVIGRHPAVSVQVLIVVKGNASVSGEDGVVHALRAGQAAVWAAGEHHETRTDEGLSALIIEGEWQQGPARQI